MVARFWRQEYPSYDQHFQAEAAAPILNKVGQIAASPDAAQYSRADIAEIRPCLRDGQSAHPHCQCRAAEFDKRRVLIANLAKGQIGEQASNLLGSLLLSHLQLVAMARSEQAPEKRAPFFVHVDEFQNFSTDAFASLLSEARKFGTHFCLANQYLEQVEPSVRAAVLGNAGTLMAFRVSSQ